MPKLYFFAGLIFVVIGLCLTLGFWQLDRADEKRQLIAKNDSQIEIPVVHWAQAKDANILTLEGMYEQEAYFLLDNQSYDGAAGYSVIVPFWLDDSLMERHLEREEAKAGLPPPRVFMVNLGWVKADVNRAVLPKVELPLGTIEIKVRIYKPSKPTFTLSERQYENEGWPKRIQYFSTRYFESRINGFQSERIAEKQIAPYETRIEKNELGAQTRHWQYRQMPAEKHQAYAVQWFVLAVVISILGALFWRKTRHKTNRGEEDD